ncbi:MAG: c-type cytochrome [Verrucomicrobia bacterium]|nr:c-type cytochrome [Verrucomicrobiota bacterium]
MRNNKKLLWSVSLISAVFGSSLFALDYKGDPKGPEANAKDMPRIPATSPKKAVKTFEVKKGFKIELAASEPLVMDPVAIDFDEDGRMFAVEMRGYSERRDEERGRIRMLVDEDDDGVFDKATIYAQGLKWPTGAVCYDGGVFVIATPDLFYFKDTDGDGVADIKKVVFTGFGKGKDRLNMQALANSLRWGPDNRIWGATAGTGGSVRRPEQPESEEISVNGRDFSFDPKKLDFRTENGTAQYGLSFDSKGRRFVSSNSNHIIAVMWENGWTQPGKYYSLPKPLQGIADDGAACPVYRISPDEPWRIIRTRWRVAGVVRGGAEGGGRVSGYFTGGTAVTLYTGDALGPDFVDNAFTGDAGSNLVHRKVVKHKEGQAALIATRPADEKEVEFLASTDNWFRATASANGPDGCLYVVDMSREAIEHPWSLPPGIKKFLDLNSGTDQGRVYRVMPENFERRKTMKLSKASNDELATLLEHPNGWHRVTAQRLLWQRGDKRAGAGWGVAPDAGTAEGRFRRALALAKEDGKGKAAELAALVNQSRGDMWVEAAALNAVGNGAQARDLFVALAKDTDANGAFLAQLAEVVGKTNDEAGIKEVLAVAVKNSENATGLALIEHLGTGLARVKNSLAKADKGKVLEPVFAKSLATAADSEAAEGSRIQAIKLCAFSPESKTSATLAGALEETESAKLQLALLNALGRRNAVELKTVLVDKWSVWNPQVRSSAMDLFLARPDRSTSLLKAVQDKKIAKTDLSANQVDLLRGHRDARVKKLALVVFPVEKKESRESVVARYQKALDMKGDAKKGQVKYETVCISCHRYKDKGFVLGPDVVTFIAAGKESILGNLFNPNKEVAPQFQTYAFTLKGGEVVVGMIANESSTEVTIRQPFGVEKKVTRKDIAGMKSIGMSLMPEGLEAALTVQDVADLLEFLTTVK